MKYSAVLAFVGAIFLTLVAVPANAQNARSWVSGTGNDANPCGRTSPCKTFAGAISKTNATGEIDCLDPGGFGNVTITKAITILCEAVSNGGISIQGTNGIVVAAGATDKVVLQGLDIEGVHSGTNGVVVTSGLAVYIVHSTIRDFTATGVNVISTTAGTRVFIKDSVIENNGTANVTNSAGVYVQGNGVNNSVSISNTVVDGNANAAVQVGAAGNAIGLVRSVLSGSPASIIAGGGNVISYGPGNVIAGSSTPTITDAYK